MKVVVIIKDGVVNILSDNPDLVSELINIDEARDLVDAAHLEGLEERAYSCGIELYSVNQ